MKEADLREVLSPAGFVWELTVPRNPDGELLCSDARLMPSSSTVEQSGIASGHQALLEYVVLTQA